MIPPALRLARPALRLALPPVSSLASDGRSPDADVYGLLALRQRIRCVGRAPLRREPSRLSAAAVGILRNGRHAAAARYGATVRVGAPAALAPVARALPHLE